MLKICHFSIAKRFCKNFHTPGKRLFPETSTRILHTATHKLLNSQQVDWNTFCAVRKARRKTIFLSLVEFVKRFYLTAQIFENLEQFSRSKQSKIQATITGRNFSDNEHS